MILLRKHRNKPRKIKISVELWHSIIRWLEITSNLMRKKNIPLPGYIATTIPFGTKPLVTKTPVPADTRELRSRVIVNPSVLKRTSSGLNTCWLWWSQKFTLDRFCSTVSNSRYLHLISGNKAKICACLLKSFMKRALNIFSSVSKTSSSEIILSWELSGTYRRVL